MHYLMMISNNDNMLFRTELAIRTIKKFSIEKPIFSIVVNGHKPGPFENPLPLKKITIKNNYIQKNSEILECPYQWNLAAPSRWFINPASEMCVLIDVDIIACQALIELEALDKNTIHGVTAYHPQMSQEEWFNIGIKETNLKYYFNFGMLVVPKKYLRIIGDKLMENIPKIFSTVNKKYHYYYGQIALIYTLLELNLPLNNLPQKFNWYDILPYPNAPKEIIFLHYFTNQHSIKEKNFTPNNKYTELIKKKCKNLFEPSIL